MKNNSERCLNHIITECTNEQHNIVLNTNIIIPTLLIRMFALVKKLFKNGRNHPI